MKILRFDITARIMHWSHAVVFIWLLLTGIHLFALYYSGSLRGIVYETVDEK